MNDSVVVAAAGWLVDPANWSGAGSIPSRLWEHVWISAVAVLARGGGGAAGRARARPPGPRRGAGLGGGQPRPRGAHAGRRSSSSCCSPEPFGIANVVTCVVVALVLFAVPPILTNAYAGIRAVDPDLVESARGMGLTGPQVLFRVELPLAVPLVVAGLRIATAQVIATATIAAFVAGPGLGRFISGGFGNQDTPQLIGGAFLVAAFAVLVEVGFQLLQRRLTPARSSRTAVDPAAGAVPGGLPLTSVGPDAGGR